MSLSQSVQIEQLARDLLARLSRDYGDYEGELDSDVESLFERGERLLPVGNSRPVPVLLSDKEIAENIDSALDMVDNSLLELLAWAADGRMPPQSTWANASHALDVLRAERVRLDNLQTNE